MFLSTYGSNTINKLLLCCLWCSLCPERELTCGMYNHYFCTPRAIFWGNDFFGQVMNLKALLSTVNWYCIYRYCNLLVIYWLVIIHWLCIDCFGQLSTSSGLARNAQQIGGDEHLFDLCAYIPNVELSRGGHFSVSAATGAIAGTLLMYEQTTLCTPCML